MTTVQITAIAFASGCAIGAIFGVPTAFTIPAILASTSLWIAPVLEKWPKYVLFFTFAGIIISSYQIDTHKQNWTNNGANYQVTGIVTNIRETSAKRSVFDLRVTESLPEGLSEKLARCYSKPNDKLKIGDIISFSTDSRTPSAATNPGEFDFVTYLESNNISLMFYSAQTPRIVGFKTSAESIANNLRQRFDDVFADNLPQRDAALLDSMVFGRRELPDDISRNFTRTGTSHIVAASGFNISIIAFSAYFLMLWITGNRKAAIIGAIIIAICYSFVAGFAPSVSRALIMAILTLGSQLLGRKHSTASGLALAVIILLAINPLWVTQPGFQLSFASTFCLFIVAPTMFKLEANKPWPYKILSALLISICIQVITLPIIASSFHTFSPISPLANLVVIPLSAILTPIGALAAVIGAVIPFLGTLLCYISYPLLIFLDKFIEILAMPTWALLSIGAMPIIVWIPYYISAGLGLSMITGSQFAKPKLAKIAIVSAITVMVAIFIGFSVANSGSGSAEVTFLDVGKGDCIFIRTSTGKTVLVDGGGGAPFLSSSDVGARVVLPFLRFRGINKIDYVIATHRDQDHIGGLFSVIRDISIGKIFDSGFKSDTFEASDFEKIIKDKGIPVSVPKFLQEAKIDENTNITFLGSPEKRIPGSDNSTMTNENSIACIIEIEKVRIFLAADIQTEAMKYELRLKDKLKCEIVKLPHHGNYSAGFSDWYEAVNPKLVINSDSGSGTGIDTRYDPVIDKSGALVYSTAQSGAITIKPNDETWSIQTFTSK